MKRKIVSMFLTPGAGAAISAALLFGASTPIAKLLTANVHPILLAGLLYLGSGFGLALWLAFRPRKSVQVFFPRKSIPWLAVAVLLGGMAGPALLMIGLARTSGASAALLLNFESVFTALLAWFVFRENLDKRIATGFLLIVAGGLILSWDPRGGFSPSTGWFAIIGACLCWALDNNVTQKISECDSMVIAAVKGIVAGLFNVSLALLLGAGVPTIPVLGVTLVVGLGGYGISLMLFVVALRNLGTARTSAYFSIAPFAGAVLSLFLLDDSHGPLLAVAGLFMAGGVWLHLTERHAHAHRHAPMTHAHPHEHDDHHQHAHEEEIGGTLPHSHEHDHADILHSHAHYPDIHHRHGHNRSS